MPNRIDDLIPQFSFLYPEIRVDVESVIPAIQRVYVRTTKAELGLKIPIRIKHAVEMSPAQKCLYEALDTEAARQLLEVSSRDRNTLKIFRAVCRATYTITL